ncbi:DUF4232 domain-containing protein [Actinomadura sp. WMMB 499]|uniref:DUF4232 domain-containing protein n=1 Tax=Actinomadura sp. WMMB 499 TaxID=1219491 RepID=UPI00159E4818|nr:DUF4232 domain-containing protein [Actinomadura sp. WMMB 499]
MSLSSRFSLRTAALAAAVALAAGCGSEVHDPPDAGGAVPVPSTVAASPGAVSPLPSPRGPRFERTACSPDGVRLEAREPDAATGLRGMRVTLVNCGDATVRLNGYPALRVLGENREPFEVRIVEGSATVPDPGPKPIGVRPGKTASIVVTWRNTVTHGTNVNGAFLEVVPADGRGPLAVRVPGGLDLGTTGRLEATAWSLP